MRRGRPDSAKPAAPAPATGLRGRLAAGHVVLAAAATALAVVAFRFHPIGDYFTESDFYGAYAAGARALLRGSVDWSRYGSSGPIYELTLAAFATLTGDLFTAARLLSVLSAIAALGAIEWLARGRWGAAAAVWLALLVASNPVFFRYGYSACTDMLGIAWWTIAVVALLAPRGRTSVLVAGTAAALATLTRYNLVSVVPTGIVLLLAGSGTRRANIAATAGFGGAFLAVLCPFAIAAIASGHPLGEKLSRDAGFYLSDSAVQPLEGRESAPPVARAAGTSATLAAVQVAERIVTGVPTHLAGDSRRLLGGPVSWLVCLSFAYLLAARRARALWALAPVWAFTFLALAPVFYSDRYSLVLLPVYVALPAFALSRAMRSGRLRAGAACLSGLLVVVLSLRSSWSLQRAVAASIPREALAAGRVLRRIAKPGEIVLARKAHVAFAARLAPLLLPDLDSLSSLGAFARRSGAHYLYYSWYELRLRPQFGFLLDTSASIPGLTPLDATTDKPSATYRIGERFGTTPEWWSDPLARRRIAARVNALMAPGRADTPAGEN